MRHKRQIAYFGRKSGPRKALLRGLVDAIVEHGRIKTTVAKAKELRRHVERAVTMGGKGTLHARRILLSRYPNEKTVSTLMQELGPKFKDRQGGYTRIIKLGKRAGDNADMAFIEFVDFAPKVKDEAAKAVEKKVIEAATARTAEKKRKKVRKLQGQARRVSRSV